MLKIKGLKKVYHQTLIKRKQKFAVLIPNKTDFRKKKNYQIQREIYNDETVIHLEDIAILNVYASNNKAANYVEKTDKTERRNKFTIIFVELNIFYKQWMELDRKSGKI